MPKQDEAVRLKAKLQRLMVRKESLEAKYKNAHDNLSREFYSWKRVREKKIKTLTDTLNLSQGIILVKLQLPPRFLSRVSVTIEDRLYGSGLADRRSIVTYFGLPTLFCIIR